MSDMGDLKDKILQAYSKIEGKLDQKQDILTQEQLANINLVGGYEARIQSLESQLSGLEHTLHEINTGS